MENQVMTPDQALTFLDTCCASVSMGRPAHVQGIQAVQILKQFISQENGDGGKPKVHSGSDQETGSTKEKPEDQEGQDDSGKEAASSH